MIRDDITLTSVICQCENILRIDYALPSTKDIIEGSIGRLENAYGMKFDKSLFDLQVETRFTNTAISDLISSIEECMKVMSLVLTVSLYDKAFGETLQTVKYCGYSRKQFLINLKYIQDKEYYNKKGNFFELVQSALDSVQNCTVKKLLVIMLVLDRLDVREGVSIIANYLYTGGVLIG